MPRNAMPEHGLALHSHRGTPAIQRLVEFAPSTGGLSLWVEHQDVDGDDAPLVQTDGRRIRYGAAFAAQPLPVQAALVAHEVLHIALRHPQRYLELQLLLGDVDLQLFNICADAIVNSALSHLGWLQLPSRSVLLEELMASALRLGTAVDSALLHWDVERLYRAIDDRGVRGSRKAQQQGDAGSQARQGSTGDSPSARRGQASRADGPISARVRELGLNSPRDLVPGPQDSLRPEDEAEATREWCERLQRAHAGDGEHSLLRTLLADLPRSRTPWEQMLRTQLARALSPQRSLSWSRPSRSYLANQGRQGAHRRMPFEPGFSPGRRVPRLALVVDVSGSIADELMERFAREIEAITRRAEAGLVLVIGDERVRQVAQFEPGRSSLREIEFHGGGGTDFTPLLEEAARHAPDTVVVLTDLEGPARYRPRCPVIWAVPEAHAQAAEPFGRKLLLR
jgi:predicted metal-dependent peptidase